MRKRCEKYRITRKMAKAEGVSEYDYAKFRAWIFEGFAYGKWFGLGKEYLEEKVVMLDKALEYRVDRSKTFKPGIIRR